MTVDVAGLVAGLEQGERRALARLLTIVEDGDVAERRAVVAALHARAGRARVIGVTGPPGVGKSTLTAALAVRLRARDRRVAVLAVDPSSPTSGGALLGDRVRMQDHHADEGVFIRSMASRGHLGGLASAAPHAVLVLDAAGFDDVIIETVGVGQSEVEVVATADTTVLVLAPGMGDSVQAAKAGILEVPDVFVVNKADHDGAGRLESQLRAMLELGHASGGDDTGTIVRCVAVRGEGIDALVDAIDAHTAALDASSGRSERAHARSRAAIRGIALEAARRGLDTVAASDADGSADAVALIDALATAVGRRETDPYAAADRLLEAWRRGP
jgi:LAO/AO transport system kinase